MKRLFIFVVMLLGATLASAQSTSVTLQVTDLDAQTWNNGSWSVQLVSPPGVPCCNYVIIGGGTVPNQQQSGALSGTGGATFTVTPNTSIAPTGTKWSFQVCAQAAPTPCFTQQFTITGASQTVTINPPAIRISAVNPTVTIQAYQDIEVINGGLGSTYFNLITATLRVCSTQTLSVCNYTAIGGGGGGAFGTLTSGVNTAAAMAVSGGATLVPTWTSPNFLGQISATSVWLPLAEGVAVPPLPSLTVNTSGGNIANGSQVIVRLTYVGLTPAVPSGEAKTLPNSGMTGCTGGNQCQVVVNMPTSCTAGNLPTGATGCTVWTSNGINNNEHQQAAANNCVNITTSTCVINTIGAGAALTFPTDASLNPPNTQANTCPDGINPTTYFQKSDGNYYPLWGIDTTAINHGAPIGVFTFCDAVFINDGNSPPIIANSIFSVHHNTGNFQLNNGTTQFSDYAIGFEDVDLSATNHTWANSITQYNERQHYDNSATFSCLPTETCLGSGRFNLTFNRTAGTFSQGAIGLTGIVFANSQSPFTYASSFPITGLFGAVSNGQTGSIGSGGITFIGVSGYTNDSGGCTGCAGWDVNAAKGGSFGGITNYYRNVGYHAGQFNTGSNLDYALLFDGGQVMFGGLAESPIYLDNLNTTKGNIAINGSLAVTGGLATSTLPLAGTGTVTPIGGVATSWTYREVCLDAAGNEATAASDTTTTLGPANLDGTHYNAVNIGNVPGCTAYNVYLIATGGTCAGGACNAPGFLGTVAATLPSTGTVAGLTTLVYQFVHNGQTASGNAPANSTNTTGGASLASFISTKNTSRLTSNFTTAANTNLQTFLSWNLANTNVQVLDFECNGSYSQATGTAAVAFGIQSPSVAPTNIFANGTMQVSTTTPFYAAPQTLATLNNTTATNIVSGTPGATGTNYTFHLNGQIELPVNSNTAINIMVSTATSGDAVTILRGASCFLTP